MPAVLPSIQQFSAPVWVMLNRLDHHCKPGGLLDGLKWHREGGLRVDGATNLPSLQPLRVAVDSAIFPGAPLQSQSGRGANSPLFNTIVVSMGIAVDQRFGFVERDPNAPRSRKGLLEWAALIMDAIETDTDGTIDSRLNLSCSKPVTFQLREPDPGELSFSSVLDVVLTSDGFYRGQRSANVISRAGE